MRWLLQDLYHQDGLQDCIYIYIYTYIHLYVKLSGAYLQEPGYA